MIILHGIRAAFLFFITCHQIAHAFSRYHSELTHDLIVNWDIIHDDLSEPCITFKHNALVFLEIRLLIQLCHWLCAFIIRLIRSTWLIHFTHFWLSEAVHQLLDVIVKLFSCTTGASIFFSLLWSDNIAACCSHTIICNKDEL